MKKDIIIWILILLGILLIPWMISFFLFSTSKAHNFYCKKTGGIQIHNYKERSIAKCIYTNQPNLREPLYDPNPNEYKIIFPEL